MKLFYVFLFLTGVSNSFTLPLPKIKKMNSLDKKIVKILKPATANYLMVPIVGMVDTFWVSKKGSVTELAAIGSADQIYNIVFACLSFLPVLLTPKISALYVKNDKKEIQNILNIAISITSVLSLASIVLIYNTEFVASKFVTTNTIMFPNILSYLKIRSIGLPFCLFNSMFFSIMQGMFSIDSVMKLNIITQILNLVLDPFMIDVVGVNGAGIATVLSEALCTLGYTVILYKKKLFTTIFRNTRVIVNDLLSIGVTIQLKILLLQTLYWVMNRQIINLDSLGVNMAAHILMRNILNLMSIVFRGLESVSSTIIPEGIILNNDKNVRNRIIYWGNIVSGLQGICLLGMFRYIHLLIDSNEVIQLMKSMLGVMLFYQYLVGSLSILDGIFQGYQYYKVPTLVSMILYFPLIYGVIVSPTLKAIWIKILIAMTVKKGIYHKLLVKL